MHFSWFSFFFFGFRSLLHWNIFRFIGYFAYYGPLSLLLSLSLLGNFPFLFRFFSLFNFNIKTYDPSYISGVWKCSCVVLVCVFFVYHFDSLSLSFLLIISLSSCLSVFPLLLFCMFEYCSSLSILELDYSSTLRSKVKITKKNTLLIIFAYIPRTVGVRTSRTTS